MNKKIKNEEGSALVLTMMVLLVLSVLGATLGTLTVGSYRLSDNSREYNSAYYIAEAGANMAYEEIKYVVNSAYDNNQTSGSFFDAVDGFSIIDSGKQYERGENGEYIFESQWGNHPKAFVTVDSNDSTSGNRKEYVIKSTGEVAGKTRKVEKPFVVSWQDKGIENNIIPSLSEKAAITFFTELQLPNKNNGDIEGLILHNETSRVSDNSGDEINEGDYNHMDFSNDLSVTINEYYKAFDAVFPSRDRHGYNTPESIQKEGGELVITENTFLNELDIEPNTVINTKGNIVNVLVNDLDIAKKATLKVKKPGTLNIFVTDSIDVSNQGNEMIINFFDNVGELNIFYQGGEAIQIPNHFKYKGSLIIKKADLSFHNHADITGTIISGGEKLSFGNHLDFIHHNNFTDDTLFKNPEDNITSDTELITSQPTVEQ